MARLNVNLKEIEDLYLQRIKEGDTITTETVTETPRGVVTSRSVTKKQTAKDALQYLQIKDAEQWNPPPPQPIISLKQETINIGLEDLKSLITPKNDALTG